ncbi:hypothetical protein EQP59_09600 [Ornithobacterium rhinotracheale]|uniref:Uncharacterized protein n=1 Tax=Ornithobacterium rhinotracheale TaxID=28251 RepID=A0A3R5X0L2_ORNRH|nr:hypothetical protein [Ornithobacterium rhinotracheale]QAR31574.1 hypothetical protein EQP59_09600 [Ornithobacterium rhinotracheale]
MFKNIRSLMKSIPTLLKYVQCAKICLHHAYEAKREIDTLFDDVEGNEPEYLNEEELAGVPTDKEHMW